MVCREALQSGDGRLELKLARKVKCRIEQRAVGRHYALGDRDPVQSGARVDAQANREIDSIAPLKPPSRKCKSLLYGPRRLSRAAKQKDPKRLDAVLFHSLGDFAYLGDSEALLQFLEHGVTGAFRRYSKRAKTGSLHCGKQLGRSSRRRKI